MQVNLRATFREIDSDQAHNNIKENVSNDAPVVLNIDEEDIHIVSIILYERMKPKPLGEPGLPVAITQTMSGVGAING